MASNRCTVALYCTTTAALQLVLTCLDATLGVAAGAYALCTTPVRPLWAACTWPVRSLWAALLGGGKAAHVGGDGGGAAEAAHGADDEERCVEP